MNRLKINIATVMTRNALGFVALSLLVGCMSMQQPTDSVFNPDNFLAQGKIALRYPNCPEYRACEEQGLSAGMDWTHNQQEDLLTFYDPLGQAQAALKYENGSIIIEKDGKSRTTNAANLEQELGIPLPIQFLRELLLTQQDDTYFNHQGWRVQVKNWQGQFYRSVRLEQDDYHIRVIIYSIESS